MRKLAFVLGALVLFVAGFLFAQTPEMSKVNVVVPGGTTQQSTLSAIPTGINDKLAIRIERVEGGKVVGKLVAKVEGQWVEVELGE